jgi:hypothetical protein
MAITEENTVNETDKTVNIVEERSDSCDTKHCDIENNITDSKNNCLR